MLQALIPAVASLIGNIIDKAIPDKDEATRLKSQLTLELMNLREEEVKAASKIIVAEAQGESWLQRNWRPILMLSITAIVVNNYLLFPYLSLFFPDHAILLELPAPLFELMSIGVGGYVVGRSIEKSVANWRGDKTNV